MILFQEWMVDVSVGWRSDLRSAVAMSWGCVPFYRNEALHVSGTASQHGG